MGEYITRPGRPPSTAFQAFAEELGPIISKFDDWSRKLLYPSLVAARGRAESFRQHRNAAGAMFGEAECYFIHGHHCDARAARRGGHFCFAVYDAVAYQMLDLFSLAFSCPAFFSAIGDPSKEDSARIAAREKPAGYGFFRKDNAERIDFFNELAHPLCPIRSQAALYFTGMALDAIWTHELAHAFMGHVNYADIHLGVRALNETPHVNGDLRQMPLEAEADRFSSATLVQSAFTRVPYLPEALTALDVKLRIRAGFVVSGLITWFWAFQQRIDRTFDGADPYSQGSHPPPLARLHLGVDCGREMLQRLGWQTPSIQAVVYDAMAEFEVLADAKNWFSIMHPSRAFSPASNMFVRNVKQIIADTHGMQRAELESLRYTVAPVEPQADAPSTDARHP